MGEARVGDTGYRLDALVQRPGRRRLAIEFLGCYFHGCPKCYPEKEQRLAGRRTAEELYEHTMRRLGEIRRLGHYRIRLVWECEWNAYLRRHPNTMRAYGQMELPSGPMQLRRDAYFGGRVETFRMLHTCAEDEEIVVVDVVSLYPAMMKHGAYPLHNPLVLTREQIALVSPFPWATPKCNRWRGFLHVRVLPPQHLRRPLLPYRTSNNQLHFTLCSRCSELEKQTGSCRHPPHQRAWIAAYTHAELNKALELGYMVIDVYEIWHYEEWASRADGNGIFDGFVDEFLKMKVEASGWKDAKSEEERRRFVDDYAREEGIQLDPDNIEDNPPKKSTSKLMLNSYAALSIIVIKSYTRCLANSSCSASIFIVCMASLDSVAMDD